MRVTAYGGIGEIGGNKLLVEDGDRRLMLDFGMSFSAHGDYYDEFLQPRSNGALRDMLRLGLLPALDGVYRQDLVRPDGLHDALDGAPEDYWDAGVQGYHDYKEAHGEPYVDALLITHAHADHFQYLSYLDPAIPVYGSRVALRMMEAISDVSAGGLHGEFHTVKPRSVAECSGRSTFPGAPKMRTGDAQARDYRALAECKPHDVAGFRVTPVPVDHSVPGACAFIVDTPSGRRILYTGDVRFHGLLNGRTKRLREMTDGLAPDLLIVEGTRITKEAADSEDHVREESARLVRSATDLAMVDFGWKDTTRFETMQRVAEATGRTLVVSPKLAYLLHRLHDLAPQRFKRAEDYPNVKVYVKRKDSMLYSLADYSGYKHEAGYLTDWGYRSADMKAAFTDGDDAYLARALAHHRDGVRAHQVRDNPDRYLCHLSFFDMNELFDLEPRRGSVYIRAACEPFNDEMKLDQRKQAQWFEAFGVNHGVDDRTLQVHASGHASGPEIKDLVKRVAPRQVLPVHTEAPDEFAGLAPDVHEWRRGSRDPVVVEL